MMATYNGEKYLHQQIDSLLNQTIQDFTIHITDDVSTDSTWDILQEYAKRHPRNIKIYQRTKNSGGAKYNFLSMMVNTRNDYLMLCDQDDVWLPNKIEISLNKVKELEQQHPNTPILVRTDMRVVNQNLQEISPSYKQSMNSNFNRTAFNQILIQNTFAGCTAIYNRALAEMLFCEPVYCIMHDWWLELVASAFGELGHVDEPTVLYRQHDSNEIGAKDVRKLSYMFNRLIHNSEVKEAIRITYDQGESFMKIYENQMTEGQKVVLRQYCAIPQMSKISRWQTICKLGSFKNGLSRNIAYLMFV